MIRRFLPAFAMGALAACHATGTIPAYPDSGRSGQAQSQVAAVGIFPNVILRSDRIDRFIAAARRFLVSTPEGHLHAGFVTSAMTR